MEKPGQAHIPEVLHVHSSTETDTLRLTIKTSADQLKMFLDVERKDPTHTVTREELLHLLPATTPQSIIHHDVLDDIVKTLNHSKSVQERRVAKGKPAMNGRDGRLVLLVKAFAGFKSYGEKEVVDRRFIRFFDNVDKGMPVGRLYPPVPGQPGINVLGEPIVPAVGKAVRASVDTKTVAIEATPGGDFENLIALTHGYVTEERNLVTVKSELVIPGNVDFRIGDIDFVGSVRVQGDVRKGFRIIARGPILVEGSSSGGSLTSASGPITVKATLSGAELESVSGTDSVQSGMVDTIGFTGASVSCGGDLVAAILSGIDVEATGNVIVEREARHTVIRTKATLKMPSGLLLASEVYAVCGAEIGTAGSAAGAPATVILCSDVESTHEYAQLTEKIASHERAQELIRLSLGPHATPSASDTRLKPDYAAKMKALRTKLTQVELALRTLRKKRDELLEGAVTNTSFRVNIEKIAHPGFTIRAGENVFRLTEALNGPKTIEFNPETKEFSVGERRALECTVRQSDKQNGT